MSVNPEMDSPFVENRYLCSMKDEGIRLNGVECPDWLLAEERRLLELSATISELRSEQKRIRSRIMSRMKQEGIRSVDSGLARYSLARSSVRRVVDVKMLRNNFPDIWEACLKERKLSARLIIRLNE